MNKNKKNKPTHAWGIAGLVAGIIGLLLLLLAPNVGILFSIVAVVFSLIQKRYESTGAATAGLILGVVGIVFYVVIGFASFEVSSFESGIASGNGANA